MLLVDYMMFLQRNLVEAEHLKSQPLLSLAYLDVAVLEIWVESRL